MRRGDSDLHAGVGKFDAKHIQRIIGDTRSRLEHVKCAR